MTGKGTPAEKPKATLCPLLSPETMVCFHGPSAAGSTLTNSSGKSSSIARGGKGASLG